MSLFKRWRWRQMGAEQCSGRRRGTSARERRRVAVCCGEDSRCCTNGERGDRGDYLLHEYQQPERDDRGGAAGEEGGGEGLKVPHYVKTSLAPGSRVVTDYFDKAGLTEYLDELGFNTSVMAARPASATPGRCRSGLSKEVEGHDLVAVSVLSGNRNFEGRINPHVKANYLASPPLVVAYALAGTIDINLTDRSAGQDQGGQAGLSEGSLADAIGSAARRCLRASTR